MTVSRRLPHTPAAPRLDSAPDTDELYPCTVDRLNREATARLNDTPIEPTPYDVLHDYVSGPEYRAARREALAICSECPIKARCWADNDDTPWVKAMKGSERGRMGPPPTAKCGTPGGARRHSRIGEPACDVCKASERERSTRKRTDRSGWNRGLEVQRAKQAAENERRMEGLIELVEAGADLNDACRALGLRRDTLNKWCQRNKVTHLYHQLGGTKPRGAAA